MEKKATSKPMRKIMQHIISFGNIEVVCFPEEMILKAPIETWPHPVHVLISFFSDGFPLDKAEAYVALRRPHCINDLTAQRLLLDRRSVYALLEANGIPHPQALIVERSPEGELRGAAAEHFSEAEDHLCIGEDKISKPFVEKPVDAEDHNICIYYPSSMGGGVKRLFRKVGDQSSSYDQHTTSVRQDGTYMYEPFMKTQGTDIKVYTVGPEYAHAEARKSPVLDGVVTRDQDGKEIRVPVVLSPREKEIARRVCLAFGQTVCGFDLLRTTADSYVIDVNGWSFVKGVEKYYEDAAAVLHDHIMQAVKRAHPGLWSMRRPSVRLPSNTSSAGSAASQAVSPEKLGAASPDKETPSFPPRSDRWQHEELLAVLAVLRHGDRTPKNKMKMTTTRSEFIELHKKWASGPRKDVKLKTPKQLQEVLDQTNAALEKITGGRRVSQDSVSSVEPEPAEQPAQRVFSPPPRAWAAAPGELPSVAEQPAEGAEPAGEPTPGPAEAAGSGAAAGPPGSERPADGAQPPLPGEGAEAPLTSGESTPGPAAAAGSGAAAEPPGSERPDERAQPPPPAEGAAPPLPAGQTVGGPAAAAESGAAAAEPTGSERPAEGAQPPPPAGEPAPEPAAAAAGGGEAEAEAPATEALEVAPPREAPQAVAQAALQEAPQEAPEAAAPEADPQAAAEGAPEAAPPREAFQAVAQAAPQAAPQEALQAAAPETAPQEAAEGAPEASGSERLDPTVATADGEADEADVDEADVDDAISIDPHTVEALRLISAVLREGGHFDGIYRKVQIKPTAWGPEDQVREVLLILKYGGILTPAGVQQAECLGRHMREAMYPTELNTVASPSDKTSNGLLRLHATQRHDFKVYSSDEGRVQMSAAAFTRGLLDLESAALTPICAALVETDPAMLDDLPHNAEAVLREVKKELEMRITGRSPDAVSGGSTPSHGSAHALNAHALNPNSATTWVRGVTPLIVSQEDIVHVPVMLDELRLLQQHVGVVCRELKAVDTHHTASLPCGQGSGKGPGCCGVSSPLLVLKRWQKLEGDLWDSKQGTWNTAKVPEIYDAVKFDLIHHPQLAPGFGPLYEVSKRINDVMVPNEYGHDERSRVKIGAMVCGQLLRKLLADLRKSAGAGQSNEELPEQKLVTAVQYLKRIFALPKWLMQKKERAEEGSGEGGAKAAEEEQEFREAQLAEPDPRHAVGVMNTPSRRVCTRLYFTSESHIQTLMNVLRYCHSTSERWWEDPRASPEGASDEERHDTSSSVRSGIVCGEAEETLKGTPVFDYLTHVVFRLYEDKRAPLGSAERLRVEVLFSPGAAGHPLSSRHHVVAVKDLQPLHMPGQPLTLTELQKLLGPFAREMPSGEPGTPKTPKADGARPPLLPGG